MEGKWNTYVLLVGKPEGRRPLRRPRRRWLDIWMDLVEVGWGDVSWNGLAQDSDRWRALVNLVFHKLLELLNCIVTRFVLFGN
jgi:hypothetical protein